MYREIRRKVIHGAIGYAVGISVGVVFLPYLAGHQPFNRIPRDKNMEEGFVQPSKLEIEVMDLDEDGKSESILKYDGKTYLLRLDENGNPIIGYCKM